jgi:MFS family permease
VTRDRRPTRARRLHGYLTAFVVDVTPLRGSRGFRWLYAGQLTGQLSRQLLLVAVPYHVFVETRSSVMVGLIGLVQIGPLIIAALGGGPIADALDRRGVLLVVQSVMTAIGVGLAVATSPGMRLWPIFALVALHAGMNGVEAPTRQAIIPSLVPRDLLPSAFALNVTLGQTIQIVGPALAGLLIARLGVTAAYWGSALSCLVTILTLLPLGPRPPLGKRGDINLGAVVEAWRYVRAQPLLQQVMLIDLNAMVFGVPRALFPVIALTNLGGDATTVGLLHAAPGVGALTAALTTGWVGAVERQGRSIVIAVWIFGLATIGFGLTTSLPAALVLLAIAGAADIVSNVFRNTILQLTVADGLRGRVTAFKTALSGGGPPLGDAQAGIVGDLTSPRVAAVSGGLATIVITAALAWRQRALWDQARTRQQGRTGGPDDDPCPMSADTHVQDG